LLILEHQIKKAERIADVLVSEKLTAGGNIFKIDSMYWLKRRIERTGSIEFF
jgi:uncharacterized protein involved in tolerance to divalent cations